MTYGFAPEPAGLGLHRIWVSVPEKNTRSTSVYQSLGFVPQGTSRDALWDVENGKYQDLIVMDTLVDEYDPIQSLDAFGMHVIEDNPGVREALSAKEHSLALRLNKHEGGALGREAPQHTEEHRAAQELPPVALPPKSVKRVEDTSLADGERQHEHDDEQGDDQAEWPYNQSSRKTSKRAWWRNIGRGRSRTDEAQKD
jgi:hypothetical protein